MTQYYECHITMQGSPDILRPKVLEAGWLFSAIDGDPNLGPGLKCYATRQFPLRQSVERVESILRSTALTLRLAGAKVVRLKIEQVILDHRLVS